MGLSILLALRSKRDAKAYRSNTRGYEGRSDGKLPDAEITSLAAFSQARIHVGIGVGHDGGGFVGCSNLDQRSRSDTGAGTGGGLPLAGGLQELGPEGEGAALRRLVGVDGAAARDEEVALAVTGLAEPAEVTGAVDVAALEGGGGHAEMAGGVAEILFAEIDEPLDFAAAGAAGLAGEADAIH